MAAVASRDGDRVGRGTGEAEASEQRQQENGGIPQEGTKEHMSVVERHLDQLTYSGSAINDLELQLSRARASYHRTLSECKVHLEETRRKLGASIPKSQPFIDVWRRARQIQEESNRAAASFDKASSQYAAAKEMIKVAEVELEKMISARTQLPRDATEPSQSSTTANDASLNHAWQEMLNHATIKVVETEQEKRASEVEHREVLDRCTAILVEYRTVERKLRPHIVKSRPYYEERWQSSQRLAEIKSRIASLEEQLRATKKHYADTLHHLDHLNHGLHQQRRANSLTPASSSLLPPGTHRHTASEGSTPDLPHRLAADHSDSESVQSWQLGDTQFTGSTGSLPSIGSSLSDDSVDRPHPPSSESQPAQGSFAANPVIRVVDENSVAHVAQEVVQRSLSAAVARLQQASLQ